MYQIQCELCNRAWASNNLETILAQFYEHLSKHSKEEVEMLRRITILQIHSPEGYQQLKDLLLEFDCRTRRLVQ
jgi:hypothetical protein